MNTGTDNTAEGMTSGGNVNGNGSVNTTQTCPGTSEGSTTDSESSDGDGSSGDGEIDGAGSWTSGQATNGTIGNSTAPQGKEYLSLS